MTSHCCYLFSPNHLQEESSSLLHHSMLHFLFCICSMIVHSDTNQQGKPVGLTDWTNRHAGKMNEVEPYQYNCSSDIKIDGKKNEMRQNWAWKQETSCVKHHQEQVCLGSLILSFTSSFFAYFKFHSDWGRVIGEIKQNELDCRDTAPLKEPCSPRNLSQPQPN